MRDLDLRKFQDYKEFTSLAINDSQSYQLVSNVGMGSLFLAELLTNLFAIIACHWKKPDKIMKSYMITQSLVYIYEALVIASEIICNFNLWCVPMKIGAIDWQKLLVSIHFSAFHSMIFIRFVFLLTLAAEVNFRRAHVRLFEKFTSIAYPLCFLICAAFHLSDLHYVSNYMKSGDGSCFYAPYAFAEVCLDTSRYARLVPSLEGTALRFMFLNCLLSIYLYGYNFRQAWLRKEGKGEKEDKDIPSQRSLWIYFMVAAINTSIVAEKYVLFGDILSGWKENVHFPLGLIN